MFDTAIIMAGGKGTRMFPVSDYVPKPLVKVRDKTLIDHCIDNLKEKGVSNIYVTYNYKSELLVSHIEKRVSGLVNTINQDNSYFLFNTIIKHIDKPVIVMPCDIIMSFNFAQLHDEYKSSNDTYILPVKYKKGMNPDFIKCKDKQSKYKVTSIGRGPSYKGCNICASGLQVLTPSIVNKQVSSSSNWNDVWKQLIDNKNLQIFPSFATNWETYDRLEQILTTEIK